MNLVPLSVGLAAALSLISVWFFISTLRSGLPTDSILSRLSVICIAWVIATKVAFQLPWIADLPQLRLLALGLLDAMAVGAILFFGKQWRMPVIGILLLISAFSRARWGYDYDLPTSWLTIGADLFCLIAISFRIGRNNLISGLALCTALATLATWVGVQAVLPFPQGVVHWSILLISFFIFKRNPWVIPKLSAIQWVVGLAVTLPVVAAVNLSVVPDADSLTQAEFVGFLLQGKSLIHTATGVPLEMLHFRYPAGMASLAYLWCFLLNLRAGESLLILLLVSYSALFISMRALCNALKVQSWMGILFLLSIEILNWQGLVGGHGYQMLAYAFGMSLIAELISTESSVAKKLLRVAILFSACFVVNPVVALPFALVLATYAAMNFPPLLASLKQCEAVVACCVFLLTAGYLYFAQTQGAELPTQPGILLTKLTPPIFMGNILRWTIHDLKVPLLILVIAALPWLRVSFPRSIRILLVAWLCGQLLIDGLFGHTEWSGRFYASFGIIGVHAIAAPVFLNWIQSGSLQKHGDQVQFALVVFWVMIQGIFIAYAPSGALLTADDIHMGRWIEANTPKTALIANMTAPKVAQYHAWGFRGLSSRDVVFSRITEHQIKRPTLVSRQVYAACWNGPKNQAIACLKNLGVTQVVLMATGSTEAFISELGVPLHREGMAAIF